MINVYVHLYMYQYICPQYSRPTGKSFKQHTKKAPWHFGLGTWGRGA